MTRGGERDSTSYDLEANTPSSVIPIRVILKGAKFHCTRCDEWKAASEFGLRLMPATGDQPVTVRNQSQCIPCRGLR